MKKEMREYLRGERNAVRDELILSRAKCGEGEMVYVSHPEIEEPIYPGLFYHKQPKPKKRGSRQTGGAKPYVMLMMQALSELSPVPSLEARGAIVGLINFIEWGTGRIYRPRNGKSLTAAMIAEVLKVKPKRCRRFIKELSAAKVLSYDRKERAYFMSRDIIKRGGRYENKI